MMASSNASCATNRPVVMRLGAAILFVPAMLLPIAAGARESVFRNWMAVCDNALTCTVFGFSAEKGAGGGFIKITREAAPLALVRAELAVAAEEAPRAQHRLALNFDGTAAPGLPTAPLPGRFDDEYVRVVLAGGRALEAFVTALTTGTILTTIVAPAPADQGKPATLTFALAGAKDALNWVDEQQGRSGTATALVARGAGRGQPPSATASVRPRRVGQVNVPKTPPSVVAAAWLEACPGEANDGADGSPGEAMRVDTGMVAWRMPCGSDHMVFLNDERAGTAKQLSFKLPTNTGANDVQVLQSASFNPARMSLSAGMIVDCTPHLGQIGYAARWLWSAGAFELVDYKAFRWAEASSAGDNDKDEETACVPKEDWPSVHRLAEATSGQGGGAGDRQQTPSEPRADPPADRRDGP
jgi:hypothetical protein